MADHPGDLVQALGDRRLARRPQPGEQREDVPELRPLALGRQALADLLVERDQADRILLVDHQVAQGRRQAHAVFELGQLLAVGVAHRPRQVHHQVARQVGLGLELLDVEPVRLGEHRPVDLGDVVPGRILPVLGELDREALERAGVQPRDEPLDDELGPEVEPGDLADHLGLQVLLGGAGQRGTTFRVREPRRGGSPGRAGAGSRRSRRSSGSARCGRRAMRRRR